MGQFIRLLHTLQGALDSMEGNFLVNDKGEFIVDHNDNFIEVAEGSGPEPPPYGEPHISVIGQSGGQQSIDLPTNTYYNYSISQQIYMPSEINYAGYITGIAFYPRDLISVYRNFSIYFSSILDSSFSESFSIPVQSGNIVFNGGVQLLENELAYIQFTTPYYYDGTSNLLLTMIDRTGDFSSYTNFDVFYMSDTVQALYMRTDTSPGYDPAQQYNMYGVTVRNAIQLFFNRAEP